VQERAHLDFLRDLRLDQRRAYFSTGTFDGS
jgi:hypothetical protein